MKLRETFFRLGKGSIARKVVTYILLSSSVIALMATAFQLWVDYRSDLNVLDARLNQIENSFAKSIADDLWNMDTQQVRVHLEGIQSLPDIDYLRVDSDDIQVIEIGVPLKANLIERKVPLVFQSEDMTNQLGELTIHASLEGIYDRLRHKVLIVLVTQGVKTFLVATLMVIIIHLLIIRNLTRIAEYARELRLDHLEAGLDLGRHRKSRHKDELDQVVEAFDHMREELKVSYSKILSANQELAMRNSELEDLKDHLEELVEERTKDLREAEQSLLENAHRAGMAEIAIGVLHHIGNMLNSINVSKQMILKEVERPNVERLIRANEMLHNFEANLIEFVQRDPRGAKLLEYYDMLGDEFAKERDRIMEETEKLNEQVQLIRQAIDSQREYAQGGSFITHVPLEDVLKDVIRLQHTQLSEKQIAIEQDLQDVSQIQGNPLKIRYILQHIIRNARDAVLFNPPSNRRIWVELYRDDEATYLKVKDNGIGIEKDKMVTIFMTNPTESKKRGGLSLHSCANAMTEMGGRLAAHSDGRNRGATFSLIFPHELEEKR
jgi:signal transduction histidine kinase